MENFYLFNTITNEWQAIRNVENIWCVMLVKFETLSWEDRIFGVCSFVDRNGGLTTDYKQFHLIVQLSFFGGGVEETGVR